MAKTVLMAHGSRDERWRQPFEKLLSKLQSELGEDKVDLCYMEFCEPKLEQIVEANIAKGEKDLKVLPMFMAAGGHLRNDVPEIFQEIMAKNPGLKLELLSPIGEHELVANAIKEVVAQELMTTQG